MADIANDKLISIIVPVYNADAYLRRCVDSILAQSFTEFEALLIDDGSSDGSGPLCDLYEKQDARIRVFHKENNGVSSARNYGLDKASGSYITFLDSDDYVGPDYLRILYEMLEEADADLSILSSANISSADAVFIDSVDQRTLLSQEEVFQELLRDSKFGFYLWGKLYKCSLFDELRFPLGKTFEDIAVLPCVVARCSRCVFSTAQQYYYFQREGSITHVFSASNLQDYFDAMEGFAQFISSRYPEIYSAAYARLMVVMFRDAIDPFLLRKDFLKRAAAYRQKYRGILKQARSLPGLTRKERVKFLLFLFSIRLYRAVRFLKFVFSRNKAENVFLPAQ